MTVRYLLLIAWLVQGLTAGAQTREIALEDLYERGTFSARGVPHFNFMKDGKHYSRLMSGKISKYSILDGSEVSVLFDAAKHPEIEKSVDAYEFSDDEGKILLFTETESIYRYSRVSRCFVYDVKLEKVYRIFPAGKIKYPSFDPSGSRVAFIYNNDLYYEVPATGKRVRITKDGQVNAIINGASDWVYEEEFTLTKAYAWSSGGDYLAYFKFDESRVKEFSIDYYNDGTYPEKFAFKYPKVGEENAVVTVWCYDLKKNKSKPIDIGPREDDYLPRLRWTLERDVLCVQWMNRNQNRLRLILSNVRKNAYRVLLEEENARYIDVHDDLTFLNDNRFLWTSERDGYNHLYLYGMDGKLVRQLTRGSEEMTALYGLHADGQWALAQCSVGEGRERVLKRINIETGLDSLLTAEPGYHSAQPGPGLRYLVLSHSDVRTPTQYRIAGSDFQTIRMLETNEALAKRLDALQLPEVELLQIPNREGMTMNAALIKPKDFVLGKKYPVFMFLYGGPGSQQVMNRWNSFGYYGWLQMLAQKGYIICVVDNRGTGGRGEEFKKMTYLQLGKLETEDQIDAARYLGSLGFVDASRIGIFGWSYGGYMSSLCLLKGNDVFKAAIAVAPVTNWKWYDTIYTERYMRRTSDNPTGYAENSPVYFADRLKGNYLLVHGLADDNVHPQNSIEMVNALVRHRKAFDMYFYPNKNHGIGGADARMHLFARMTDFVLNKL